MKSYARKRGGKCLSTEYLNSKTHLLWRCESGHEWSAKPDHVLKGHWCPICSAGVSERICRALLQRIVGVAFPKHRPSWLINERGRRMELDGYATELKLAFEYHGRQHYQQTSFFHGDAIMFEQRRRDDKQKRRLCGQRAVVLLEIPYSVPHGQLQNFLVALLRRVDHKLVRDETPIEIAELRLWQQKDVHELRAVAASRGGELLSNSYINNSTKLRWRCAQSHEWLATSASVKQGTWCPKCGDSRAAQKRAKTIEEMRAIAIGRGGTYLSGSYSNVKSRLRWRCAVGHEWETQASVIVAGHWCPKCEWSRLGTKFALSFEEIRETARNRGGECLAHTYVNSREKLTWRCAKGHEWSANANSVRRGSWCPVCWRRLANQEYKYSS
jgi:hypothetical protein